MTFAAWVKIPSTPSGTVTVMSLDDNNQQNNCMFIRPDGLGVGTLPAATGIFDGSWNFAQSTTDVTTGNWHHIMSVWYSATRRTVYLDGNYYAEETVSRSDTGTYHFAIGYRRTSDNRLTGDVAEVAVWDYALEQNEASQMANGKRPNEIDNAPLEYWPLKSDKSTGITGGTTLNDNGTGITYDAADHPALDRGYSVKQTEDDGEDTSVALDAANDYAAQTFTAPSTAYKIGGVDLKIWTGSGDDVGRIEVELQGVDGGGDPDGTIHASGIIDTTEIADSEGTRPWVRCYFYSPYALTASTQYAIVVHGDSCDASNILYISKEATGTYGGGADNFSTDGGTTWTGPNAGDLGFQAFSHSYVLTGIEFDGAGSIDIGSMDIEFNLDGIDFQGTGSILLGTPATSNSRFLGAIKPGPDKLIQTGWDAGCNQGSISQWDQPIPQIMTPMLNLGSAQQTEQSPMDQEKHSGAGIVEAVQINWYEAAHLIPRVTQDVGNIVSEQTILGELYNADRKNQITVSSVVNNLGTGIEITGVPAVPFNIDAEDGVPFTITVKRTGDLTINATYTFVLSTGEQYTVTIVGSRIVLLPYRPEAPMREHLIFDTKIVEAVDGTEQRIANREFPRGLIEATYRHERKAIEMILFDRQSKVVAVPAWHEPAFITSAASVSDLTVNVNTTDYANFYVGGYAVVLEDQYTYDALKIESMTATSITFESGLSFDYTTKAQVMPLMTCYIEASSASMKKPYNEQDFNLRLHVHPTDNDIADSSGWSTYDSDVFLDDPNMIVGGQLSESLRTKVFVLDNLTGFRTTVTAWDHNKRHSKKGFKTNTREELWKLRQLLHFLKGRQVSFYIPTFSKDIVPIENMQVGTFAITMDNIGYTTNAYQRWPKQVVRVVFKDGTKLTRTIQNSSEVSSAVEQITLDIAWPATYTPDDIERIEFLEKVRLAVDDIVLVHYNALGQSQCVVDIVEVDE